MPTEQAKTAGVAENPETPGIDAPPDAFAADAFVPEADEPVPIADKGFGPVNQGLTDEEMAELEKTAKASGEEVESTDETPQGEQKPAEETPPSGETSKRGDDEKEPPQHVPYDRFKQVIEENQRLKRAEQVLQWIMENPERAAAKLGTAQQPSQKQEPRLQLDLEEPKPTKPIDEMTEEERAELWIKQNAHKYLKGALEKIVQPLEDLLTFKEQISETMVRNAVGPDGKPLYPRWDELKGTMSEIKARYQGMSDVEAYVLADKMVPQQSVMGNEFAQYEQQQQQAAAQQTPAPTPKPKRASPEAIRAAKLASLGRASAGMVPTEPELLSPEKAAEKAFEEILRNETG